MRFLRVKNTQIQNHQNKKVILKGINLGGWLLMEGYLLGGGNISEYVFKDRFKKRFGYKELKKFEESFRSNFITEEDIKRIKKLGANCIRIPFNYRLFFDDAKKSLKEEGFKYLDKVINWAKEYDLYCILDMHAAPGAQNPDWHADSSGKALLWCTKKYKRIYVEIWKVIAQHYKDEASIAGYDVLNEPVVKNTNLLRSLYKELIQKIRLVDTRHIIFLEANLWSQDIFSLGPPLEDNVVYSIHIYQPLEFSFSFIPNLSYPGKIRNSYWNKKTLYRYLKKYWSFSKKYSVPIFVGEFGINFRCGRCFGELRWLKDILKIFKDFEFSWTYWTYKAVASRVYPDGIYQYMDNPGWIKREGPILGWENFLSLWPKYKRKIIASWRTENFILNEKISKILKNFF